MRYFAFFTCLLLNLISNFSLSQISNKDVVNNPVYSVDPLSKRIYSIGINETKHVYGSAAGSKGFLDGLEYVLVDIKTNDIQNYKLNFDKEKTGVFKKEGVMRIRSILTDNKIFEFYLLAEYSSFSEVGAGNYYFRVRDLNELSKTTELKILKSNKDVLPELKIYRNDKKDYLTIFFGDQIIKIDEAGDVIWETSMPKNDSGNKRKPKIEYLKNNDLFVIYWDHCCPKNSTGYTNWFYVIEKMIVLGNDGEIKSTFSKNLIEESIGTRVIPERGVRFNMKSGSNILTMFFDTRELKEGTVGFSIVNYDIENNNIVSKHNKNYSYGDIFSGNSHLSSKTQKKISKFDFGEPFGNNRKSRCSVTFLENGDFLVWPVGLGYQNKINQIFYYNYCILRISNSGEVLWSEIFPFTYKQLPKSRFLDKEEDYLYLIARNHSKNFERGEYEAKNTGSEGDIIEIMRINITNGSYDRSILYDLEQPTLPSYPLKAYFDGDLISILTRLDKKRLSILLCEIPEFREN